MSKQKSNPLFITVSEAHREYGLSETTWWNLIKTGKIRCYRPDGIRRTLLSRYDIQGYLSGREAARDTRKNRKAEIEIQKDVAVDPISANK